MYSKFIIQDEVFGDEQHLLEGALKFCGIEYEVTTYSELERVKCDQESVFHRGTTRFCETLDPNEINLPNYTYTTYSEHLKTDLLNDVFVVFPWWKLSSELLTECLGPYLTSCRFFIRPNSGEKLFTGTSITQKYFDKELRIVEDLPSSQWLTSSDLVICSPWVEIDREYRVFMGGTQVIDYCMYSGDGKISKNTLKMLDELPSIFENWVPHPFFVVDLAESRGETYILEINSAACAGWYDMDHVKIVKSLAGA